jgi:hypothetical protein
MPSNEGAEIILGLLHPPTSNFYAIRNGYVFKHANSVTIKDLPNNAVSEHYQALYCQ